MASSYTNFPRFAQLPLEIQREIWYAALQEERGPKVCPFHFGLPPQHLDFEYKVPLARVCREARAAAISCLGPRPDFRPGTDALYVRSKQGAAFFNLAFLASWPISARVRHLVLDASNFMDDLGDSSLWADFAFCLGRFSSLQTVSICFHARRVSKAIQPRYQLVEYDEDGDEDDVFIIKRHYGFISHMRLDQYDIVDDMIQKVSYQPVAELERAPFDDTGMPLFDVVPRKMILV